MTRRSNRSSRIVIWSVSGCVVLVFLGLAYGAIKLLLSDDSGSRKRHVQMVTLLKPPPPPRIKEQPPEPEIKKQEEIVEQQEQEPEPDPMEDVADDQGPMDDDLGLDAEGSGGGDGFGLQAKKGGRSLIGGFSGNASLLRRYAWYTNLLTQDFRKLVNKYMEANGGVPDGNLVAHIQITLDESGHVIALALQRSSGNLQMDRAVETALLQAGVSEPPPQGMPRVLQLKISSKG